MVSKWTRLAVFLLLLIQLSSCNGTPDIPVTGEITSTPGNSTEDSQVIGTVSNIRTQVHAGTQDNLKLIQGQSDLGNDDFVSVRDGGKARLEFPGPISLLLYNQSDMDGIKLEYDENSNPRIVNRLIRGGFSGYVSPGHQLTVDLAFGVKVNVLGTRFFIVYDEESGFIIIGKFDGTLTVTVPGQETIKLDDLELVDITADGTIKHYSPFSFTPIQFENMADDCNSPIQGVNILRRDNGLPLPGEVAADPKRELPCGSSSPAQPAPITWIDLDYCNKSDKDICVYALGLVNQNMMITLQVDLSDVSEPYILIKKNRYPCTAIGTSQNKYYCIGKTIPANQYVTIQVFHREEVLLAQGDFLMLPLVTKPAPKPRRDKYPY